MWHSAEWVDGTLPGAPLVHSFFTRLVYMLRYISCNALQLLLFLTAFGNAASQRCGISVRLKCLTVSGTSRSIAGHVPCFCPRVWLQQSMLEVLHLLSVTALSTWMHISLSRRVSSSFNIYMLTCFYSCTAAGFQCFVDCSHLSTPSSIPEVSVTVPRVLIKYTPSYLIILDYLKIWM